MHHRLPYAAAAAAITAALAISVPAPPVTAAPQATAPATAPKAGAAPLLLITGARMAAVQGPATRLTALLPPPAAAQDPLISLALFQRYPAGEHVTGTWNAYPLHPAINVNPDPHSFLNWLQPSATRAGNTLRLTVTPFGDNQPGHLGLGFTPVPGPSRRNQQTNSLFTMD